MNDDDDVRRWFTQARRRAKSKAGWTVGDVIADWRSALAPAGLLHASAFPEEPVLFPFRWYRRRSSPEPDDSPPDIEFGLTRGGLVMRTKRHGVIRDRDEARRKSRQAGPLIADLRRLMAGSRHADAVGRGTDTLRAIRALAYQTLRLRGMTKSGAARRLYVYEGWTHSRDGPLDRDQLRTRFQIVERTLRTMSESNH